MKAARKREKEAEKLRAKADAKARADELYRALHKGKVHLLCSLSLVQG